MVLHLLITRSRLLIRFLSVLVAITSFGLILTPLVLFAKAKREGSIIDNLDLNPAKAFTGIGAASAVVSFALTVASCLSKKVSCQVWLENVSALTVFSDQAGLQPEQCHLLLCRCCRLWGLDGWLSVSSKNLIHPDTMVGIIECVHIVVHVTDGLQELGLPERERRRRRRLRLSGCL